ncbi:MAG: N-6 DNA methylase [Synergistaceae bacterium]|nr:N-6 DNA methylase [Synergistaceae bacterium]
MSNINDFIKRWQGRGDEKSDSQTFWLDFLHNILDVDNPGGFIKFEKRVRDEHVNFIDGYIASTQVLIEQKSFDADLDAKVKQSDCSYLTPFEQAKKYYGDLPHFENPRWIIICNFQEFRIYDMNCFDEKDFKPEIVKLENFEKEWQKFLFMIDPKAIAAHEEKISIEAGKLVEKLKESLKGRYKNPKDENELLRQQRSLTILCVRIVFLLYAEDSGLFDKGQFHDYLKAREITARDSLIRLFDALNTKISERDFYLEEGLRKFPLVNGGLFMDKNVEIPLLDGEPLKIILEDMSEGFDWSGINPPIFGAIFERVLSSSESHERESGGMHYTTIENIHKVIDPLFLDDLKAELGNIFAMPNDEERTQNLLDFQNKLAALRFLDPACGSGNFLTESFKSLRTLENKIIRELKASGNETKIKVSISQFYGIEVNPFAVAVARTALWIADNQMWREIKDEVTKSPLPLEDYDHIKEGSAMDKLEGIAWGLPGWKIPHDDMLYIMGNPPFLGYSQQNEGQKTDVRNLLGSGKVDYVACWFAIASEYVQDKKTKAAFVATNSITQGEQVSAIFKPLRERWGIEIDFAHQSFVWDSELKDLMAHVHCVVIGFSTDKTPRLKKLYTPEGLKLVENINFYLKPAPKFFLEARKKPICEDAPVMTLGNLPRDGGHLILTPEEREELLDKNPEIEKFIKPYVGADEFINNIPRYCLWLVDSTSEKIRKIPAIKKRIDAVKKFRIVSKREATQKLVDKSWLFAEIRQPETNYIAIPLTTSETRKYIPMGFMSSDIIISNAISIIPDATLYHFGILTSRVHMAWMRATAGRLKSDYRYSNTVVYNNFVWPTPSKKQRAKIEETAQKILDERAKYPEDSFAALYDDTFMPPELRKAHKANDAAVCGAYGFAKNISEEEIVSELMRLYENFVIK